MENIKMLIIIDFISRRLTSLPAPWQDKGWIELCLVLQPKASASKVYQWFGSHEQLFYGEVSCYKEKKETPYNHVIEHPTCHLLSFS